MQRGTPHTPLVQRGTVSAADVFFPLSPPDFLLIWEAFLFFALGDFLVSRMAGAGHYRISILRRVLGAHGEAPQAHGEIFAEGGSRRSADGSYRHGKGRVCRVPNFGHMANTFTVCLSRYTAQKSKKTAGPEPDGVGMNSPCATISSTRRR